MIHSRPHLWFNKSGSTMTDKDYVEWAALFPAAAAEFVPLYTRESVEAAIWTERKRFSGMCRVSGCDLLAAMVCAGELGLAK